MAQNDNNNNPAGAGGTGVVVEPGKAAEELTPEMKEEAKKLFEKLTPEQIEDLKKAAAKKPDAAPAKKDDEVATGAGSEASDDDDPWYTDVRFWIGLGAGVALAGSIWLAIELFFGDSEEAIDIPA